MKSHVALQISAAGIIACSAAFPHAVYGACARGDVDYYLSKGFTRDQVVAICTGALPKPRRSPASEVPSGSGAEPGASFTEEPTPLDQAASARMRDDLEAFLTSAIDGYDVRMTPKALYYTRRTCIEYGPYNEYGIKTEACPDVRYAIARAGMRVRDIRQALLLLGNYEVTVSGAIERQILALDQYPPGLKARLSAYLETGGETTIHIRDGIPRERLETALREIPL